MNDNDIEIVEEKRNVVKTSDVLLLEIQKEDPTFQDTQPVCVDFGINIDFLKAINMNDLTQEEVKPFEYIVNPILPTQGLGFIYAATGVGKTLFALNLAYAIAAGGRFLKYVCPKPRRVLYVDGEMAFNQLLHRIKQIVQQQGTLEFDDNFLLITPDKMLPHSVPQIDTTEGQLFYNKFIQKYNIEVIIFDNLSVLSSFDENKANEWRFIQKWLIQLRSIGKSVIVIHHCGKTADTYRGTSKMLDCADFAILLQNVNDDTEDEAKLNIKKFKVVYQKNRAFGGQDAVSYEVQLHNNQWGFQTNEQTLLDKIINCARAGMKQREIAKELLTNQPKVHRLLKSARARGLIE